jgi:ParB family chromosome partitioning protein
VTDPKKTALLPNAVQQPLPDSVDLNLDNEPGLSGTVQKPIAAASVTVLRFLDPRSIQISRLPNRAPGSLINSTYFELQESIRLVGRNIEPIKVRRITPTMGDDGILREFEEVYGHRRRHACLELGVPVHAEVVDEMTDRQVLLERIAENAGRADFAPLELGLILLQALDSKICTMQKQLSVMFGVDEALVSKALILARLPAEVIASFESPTDLQFRHAKPLQDALAADRDRVLEIARRLANEPSPRLPGYVFKQLTSVAETPVEPFNLDTKRRPLTYRGSAVGEIVIGDEGHVSVSLKRRLDADSIDALEKFIQEIVASSSATSKTQSPRAGRGAK